MHFKGIEQNVIPTKMDSFLTLLLYITIYGCSNQFLNPPPPPLQPQQELMDADGSGEITMEDLDMYLKKQEDANNSVTVAQGNA